MTSTRWLGVVLIGLAVLPAAAVATEGAAFLLGGSRLAAFERLFGAVCHHLSERTLVWDARSLPVCARCTGMWLGAAGAGFVGLGLPPRPSLIRSVGRGALVATAVALVAAVVETTGAVQVPNGLRAVFGSGLAVVPPFVAGIGARMLVRSPAER